jgi:tetratricopeptide (TPR) repeat protein
VACLDDNTIAAFLGGELNDAQRAAVNAHLETCSACRQLVAALVKSERDDTGNPSLGDTLPSSGLHAAPKAPERLGRYVVLGTIGAGGMGHVFSAYDPVLERKVALKVVKSGRAAEVTEEVKARLLREGKSIAQLNHPNIVSVFDMGTSEGEVYVAMELVEGGSLKQWLAASPRDWRAVLTAFLEAGRGLAAAHRAGLVHRDFKPENVLVGTDGRVRVSDFGLSMSLSPREREPTPVPLSVDPRLTQTGALVGTPAYMAPEQLKGHLADALSDQFSFCVALWESLTGVRPFASRLDLDAAKWQRVEPPPSVRVPPWVRRALDRGLALEPSERFPSMEALLDALSTDPAVRRRRAWLLAGAAALTVALVAGGVAFARRVDQRCTGAPALAEAVWNPTVAATVKQAVTTHGSSDVAALVERRLGEYVAGWTAMHTEACQATRVRGEQSDQVLTLRMACLEHRRTEAKALVQLLSTANADVALRAPEAVEALTPLSACADTEALLAQVPPPERPDVQARVDAVRQELAASKAQLDVGRYDDAKAGATDAVTKARAAEYPPVLAEALVHLGRTQEQLGDLKGAEATLLDALSTAEASRHDVARAEAATALMLVLGVRQARYAEAHAWDKLAEGAIARVGRSPLLEARLLQTRGLVRYAEGKLQEAIEAHQQAVALFEQVDPQGVSLAAALNELGAAFRGARKAPEAMAAYQRALALAEARVGADSDLVATSRNGLANTFLLEGRFDEALPLYQQALAVFERRLGPQHYRTVTTLNNVGVVLAEQGRYRDALPYFEKVVAARDAVAADAKAADAHANLGMLLLELGRLDDADAQLERAKGLLQGLPLDHFSQAEPLLGAAKLSLARHDGAKAEAPLERVLALCAGKEGFRFEYTRARAQFLMARVLLEVKHQPAEGRALAEQARTALVGFGEQRFRRDIGEVSRWLDAHLAR